MKKWKLTPEKAYSEDTTILRQSNVREWCPLQKLKYKSGENLNDSWESMFGAERLFSRNVMLILSSNM